MKMTNSSQFYEGCGQEGPIRCIFLSEFHDTAGSKITCQVNTIQRNDITLSPNHRYNKF